MYSICFYILKLRILSPVIQETQVYLMMENNNKTNAYDVKRQFEQVQEIIIFFHRSLKRCLLNFLFVFFNFPLFLPSLHESVYTLSVYSNQRKLFPLYENGRNTCYDTQHFLQTNKIMSLRLCCVYVCDGFVECSAGILLCYGSFQR